MADGQTTTYSFVKPEVSASDSTWGGKLNGNWDGVDDLLDGTTPVTGIDINSGSIDGTPIGAASASTGAFTTISASGTFTGAAGTFTTIGASGAVTFDTTLTVGGELTATGGVKFASGTYIDNAGFDLELHAGAGGDVKMDAPDTGAYIVLANGGLITTYRPTSTAAASLVNFRSDVGGVSTQVAIIDADGDINNATGVYGTISDGRVKEGIEDATSQWDDVKKIKFRKYTLKNDKDKKPLLGVVAQELQAAQMGGLVGEGEDGTLNVKTSVLLLKCAVALQEAMARIEALEKA